MNVKKNLEEGQKHAHELIKRNRNNYLHYRVFFRIWRLRNKNECVLRYLAIARDSVAKGKFTHAFYIKLLIAADLFSEANKELDLFRGEKQEKIKISFSLYIDQRNYALAADLFNKHDDILKRTYLYHPG